MTMEMKTRRQDEDDNTYEKQEKEKNDEDQEDDQGEEQEGYEAGEADKGDDQFGEMYIQTVDGVLVCKARTLLFYMESFAGI